MLLQHLGAKCKLPTRNSEEPKRDEGLMPLSNFSFLYICLDFAYVFLPVFLRLRVL